MRISANSLKKMEEVVKALQYKLRYEKGQFQSGFCIVKNQKIVVVNKFFTLEARINCMLDLFPQLELTEEDKKGLTPEQKTFLAEILQDRLNPKLELR
jgi:hypothetical protein